MSRYQFSIDRKPPSDKEILKHKNFSRLKSDFEAIIQQSDPGNRIPIYKTPGFWIGACAASVLLIAAFMMVFNSGKKPDNSLISNDVMKALPIDTNHYTIDPPFNDFQIKYETHVMSANKSVEIRMASSTVVKIPENAFVDAQGGMVSGNVTLKYREFHKPLEFFLSGIPMSYDSAGINMQFESAGMFELRAYKGEEELLLNPSKSIDVEMISYDAEDDFNLYYFDEKTGRWIYLCSEMIIIAIPAPEQKRKASLITGNKTQEKEISKIQDSITVSSSNKTENLLSSMNTLLDVNSDTGAEMIKPRKAGKGSYLFKLDIDVSSFPELSAYSNVLFEIDESKKKFDPKLYAVVWERVEISRSVIPDHYNLLLGKNDTTLVFSVRPVFEENDYQKAISSYDAKIKSVETEREKWEKAREAEVSRQYSASLGSASLGVDPVNEFISYYNELPSSRRQISIPNLGLWNVDKPIPLPPNNEALTLNFISMDGSKISFSKIYFVDKKVNTLYTVPKGIPIRMNRKAENILWIVTVDNKIAFIPPDLLRKLINESKNPDVIMTIMDQYQGMQQIKSYLNS